MARRELLAGYTHEIAKMLGVTPSEDRGDIRILAQIDSFGRRVSLEERWATPAVRITEIVIRDSKSTEVASRVDLINGEIKSIPGGGIKIVDVKADSFTVNPNSPATIRHSQTPSRY